MTKMRLINQFTVWDAMEEARAAIQRVRELHEMEDHGEYYICAGCDFNWPCDTIKALDGEQ